MGKGKAVGAKSKVGGAAVTPTVKQTPYVTVYENKARMFFINSTIFLGSHAVHVTRM